MSLSIIVAVAKNGVIGNDGKMPWRLPAESAYFKKTTIGHPVITGRKNYEAMGRALPDRLNVVITRQPNYPAADGVIVVHSLEEALALAEVKQAPEAFVIGGQQLYELAMPLADKLYLTTIDAEVPGDTFFRYNPDEWQEIWSQIHPADNENKYPFTLRQLVRR